MTWPPTCPHSGPCGYQWSKLLSNSLDVTWFRWTCVVLSLASVHGNFARTFYSERISEIIAKQSQKYHFYLVITQQIAISRTTTPGDDISLIKSRATNHGIAIAFWSIATVIHVRWWRLVARWKAHDPRSRFKWSAAGRTDKTSPIRGLLSAPSNLRSDSKASTRAKRKQQYRLIYSGSNLPNIQFS